ncbi:unnamed protein product [Rodentolepis nana]|uniref:G_PROTEIN_RECEP_F1_2 domain-containing protein n=1 Tax=Rodentolepis nana TaxID=102285 RepID=A0A0R3TK09_RODNA|nr:unnamed protein product [Rodentolepis nana]
MTTKINSSIAHREIIYSHWLIFGPLSCPVAFLGFIGNLLTLQTLSQPQLTCINSSVFLKFLSVADAALIFFYFISFKVNDWMDNSVYYKVIYPLALISQTSCVYTVVLFSIVRYITICHPFGLHSFRTRRLAKIMVSCIFAFAVICNLPRVFEHIPLKLRIFNSTCNCEIIEETRLGEQDLYVKLYVSYGYTFGIFVIPVGIVSVLNARLGSLLHRVRQEFAEKKDDNQERSSTPFNIRRDQNLSILQDGRSELSEIPFRGLRGSVKDKSNVRMTHARARVTGRLFCLVSVFIAFQSLPMIDNLIIAFMSEPKETIPNYDDFYAICQFSVLVNSSINTVLYCFLGQRFRATFRKMIHRWQDDCYACFKLVSCQLCSLSK